MPLEQYFFPSQNSDASSAQQDGTSKTLKKLLEEFKLGENSQSRSGSFKEVCSAPFVLKKGRPLTELVEKYAVSCPDVAVVAWQEQELWKALDIAKRAMRLFALKIEKFEVPAAECLNQQEEWIQCAKKFLESIRLHNERIVQEGKLISEELSKKLDLQREKCAELSRDLIVLSKMKETLFDMFTQAESTLQHALDPSTLTDDPLSATQTNVPCKP